MTEPRKFILVANWKMNKTAQIAETFVRDLCDRVAKPLAIEVAIAPPFTALDRVAQGLAGSDIAVAAQNVNAQPEGAHTGEISGAMLAEFGCRYGIVGHSERRALYGEIDLQIAAKAVALQNVQIRPIVCVGESLDDRDAGRALDVVGRQLAGSLEGVAAPDGDALVIAYEPVWAIGTGRVATPEIAQEVHGFIRARLGERYGEVAESIRIQYGGSVNPDNAASLMGQPDIDGALVGGASLQAETFAALIETVAGVR